MMSPWFKASLSTACCFLFLCAPAVAAAQQIALTWDDLPAHGALPPGETRLELAHRVLAVMQEQHLPPVYGFINGVQLDSEPEGKAVLDAWVAAGNLLGNHTWSHMNLNENTATAFLDQVARNESLLSQEMPGKDWHWLRYPFLAEGKDAAQRQEVRDALAARGYRIAAVTMGFPDYDWNPAYARCVAKKDDAAIRSLELSYAEAARASALYSRQMSKLAFGRDIPYVLLLHIGAMDAHMLPLTLMIYRKLGFTFVPLETAESDPFYQADLHPELNKPIPSLPVALQARGIALPPPPVYPDLSKLCQ